MSWSLNIILIFLFLIPILVILYTSVPWLFGAPYEPSRDRAVKRMIEFANVKKGEKAVDIGSGNGKVVIALAKAGAEAHGFEINPVLIARSRRNIKKAGLEGKAFIHLQNFWKADFSDFNIITTFQFKHIMYPLEKKFKRELKKGSRVISNTWKFPHIKPDKEQDDILLYQDCWVEKHTL